MKRILFGFPIFCITFAIGFVVVPQIVTLPNVGEPSAIIRGTEPLPQSTLSPIAQLNLDPNFKAEFEDLPNLGDLDYPNPRNKLVDVFQRDGIYRESEVVAKTGEEWLVLSEAKGKYSVVRSKVRVQKLRTISYVGDEYDVRLTFDHSAFPIFAVKNIKAITPGPITTVYHGPSQNESDRRGLPVEEMRTGYRREFDLNKKSYTLRVSQGLTRDGTKVGVLVLEHEGGSQVIAATYHDPRDPDIIGNLYWAGDLDNDGNLDLYFDEYNEKGGFGSGLYLSSAAEKGKLVKLIATFGTAGC